MTLINTGFNSSITRNVSTGCMLCESAHCWLDHHQWYHFVTTVQSLLLANALVSNQRINIKPNSSQIFERDRLHVFLHHAVRQMLQNWALTSAHSVMHFKGNSTLFYVKVLLSIFRGLRIYLLFTRRVLLYRLNHLDIPGEKQLLENRYLGLNSVFGCSH